MPRTLNSNFRSALLRGEDVLLIVDVQWGSGATDRVRWSHNKSGGPLFGHPNVVRHVTPFSRQVRPYDARATIGTMEIELSRDDEVRDLVKDRHLHSKRVIVRVGFPSLVEADYEEVWHGAIVEAVPKPWGMSLQCGDPSFLLRDKDIRLAAWGEHPVLVAKRILQALLPASLIDTTNMDPAAALWSDISHWVVSRHVTRYGLQAVAEPASALGLLDELLEMLNASLAFTEDGKYTLLRPSATGSAVRTFADGTMADIEQPAGAYADAVNEVEIGSQWRGRDTAVSLREAPGYWVRLLGPQPGEYMEVWEHRDTAAQALFAWHDGAGGVVNVPKKKSFQTRWLNGCGRLATQILAGAGAGTTFDLYGNAVGDCCGCGSYDSAASPAVPAALQATTVRTVLVKIDDEVIECDQVTPSTTIRVSARWDSSLRIDFDVSPSAAAVPWLPHRVTFRVKTRNVSGSSGGAVQHDPYDGSSFLAGTGILRGQAWDVTIPRAWATSLVDRFAHGMPVVRFATPLSDFGVLLRENVAIEDSDLRRKILDFFNHNGVTIASGDKWEVLAVEEDWLGTPPRIIWTVGLIATGKGSTTTRTSTTQEQPEQRDRDSQAIDVGTVWRQQINSGLALAAGSGGGLHLKVGAGELRAREGGLLRMIEQDDIPLPASRDCYVSADDGTGDIVVQDTALGAGDPGEPVGLFRLGKQVTAGAALGARTDQRQLTQQSWRSNLGGANKGLTAAGAWTAIQPATVVFDKGDSGTYGIDATGQYVAPYDREYEVGGAVGVELVAGVAVGDLIKLGVFVAGALVVELDRYTVPTGVGAGAEIGLSGWTQVQLAKGQACDLRVWNGSAIGVHLALGAVEKTWFAGRRLD